MNKKTKILLILVIICCLVIGIFTFISNKTSSVGNGAPILRVLADTFKG